MVKKIFVLGCTILGVLIFSSCSIYRDRILSGTEKALTTLDEKANVIVHALGSNDLTILTTCLSQNALNSDDIGEGFAYCCSLLNEKVTSIERKGCPLYTYTEAGKNSYKGDASFVLVTESGKKLILAFEYWFTNEFDENQIGVNCIKLSDFAAADKNYKPVRLYERSGIYSPGWDND